MESYVIPLDQERRGTREDPCDESTAEDLPASRSAFVAASNPIICLCLESKKRRFRSSASYFVRLSFASGLGPGTSVNSKKCRQSTSYFCKSGATDTDDVYALSIHYHDCFEEVKEEVVLKTTTQWKSERIMARHVFSPRGLIHP